MNQISPRNSAFAFYGFDIPLQQLLSDDEFTHYVWTFCTFIDAEYSFSRMTVDFWHSQSQCLCCRCPRTTCHWPTNLARELQPSLLAKDVSPERKPLKAARRDGCIRRPVGIFICYLVTVSTSKYCISSSHMGAVLTCSLHDE